MSFIYPVGHVCLPFLLRLRCCPCIYFISPFQSPPLPSSLLLPLHLAMKFLTTAALLAACVSPAASLPTWRTAWKSWSSVFSREQACNGRTEYCGRKYSEIAFIGAHDSPFVGELPSQNQHWSVEDQLAHGVRFLQGQTHKNIFQSDLELCHTNCFLEDAGLAVNFLKKIKKFLDNNPNEVVTLLLTNGDNLEMDWFDKPFRNSGVKDYVYIPPGAPAVLPIGNWPTLGQLISSNKRLVVFIGTYFPLPLPPSLTNIFNRLQNKHATVPLPPRRIRLLLRNGIQSHRPKFLGLQRTSTPKQFSGWKNDYRKS